MQPNLMIQQNQQTQSLQSLSGIRNRINHCTDCNLHCTRETAVPGWGAPDAGIFVVGEAPGYWEEKKGQPFVGRSGKLLTELFEKIGVSRRRMYFANTVNCRPPDNRDPMVSELAACQHYIHEQLEIVDPKVVVTAGRFSLRVFFPSESITSVHGQARYDGKRIYMAMFHPAAALHNPSTMSLIEEDFYKLGSLLKTIKFK